MVSAVPSHGSALRGWGKFFMDSVLLPRSEDQGQRQALDGLAREILCLISVSSWIVSLSIFLLGHLSFCLLIFWNIL